MNEFQTINRNSEQNTRKFAFNNVSSIRELVADDLKAMQSLIKHQLISNIPLIETIAEYIIDSGGKQIRPLLTLLSAKLFHYEGEAHYPLSTVIEFVHTATLLHDDVIDASHLRRGKTAAHDIWGNQASVLVGDFLYSRAFQILTQHQDSEVLSILANATNAIVEGEMNQLINKHNPELTESNYLQIIQCKTASLFSAASEIGAVLAQVSNEQRQALAHYGLALGTCFQIIDDLLDYTSSVAEIGKNIGDDLAEGKVTLPLIYTLQECPEAQNQQIKNIIRQGDVNAFQVIIKAMTNTSAIQKTYQFAEKFALKAQHTLLSLPDNIYRDALYQLASLVIERRC
jgi:octaprenyl-diphosphate synthase